MERARTEFLTQLGYDKPAILASGLMLVVHSMNITFVAPTKLSEQLLATAKVKRLARSYVVFEQTVKRDDKLVCSADVKVACISQAEHRPKAMPAVMYEFLQGQMVLQ